MFHTAERLPHLLSASDYCSDESHELEREQVFAHSWHFAGLTTELPRHGDFITLEICGQPIQVRNFEGTIKALSNICAHRHCLLTSLTRGSSQQLKCQYHGWEYNAAGLTQRIPLAQHFAPLDRTSAMLPVYRVETAGPLIFVNLDPAAPELNHFLGDHLNPILQGFGEGWELMFSKQFPLKVNWKIPVENSLEAYHVPAIHAKTFRSDPGELVSEHSFGEQGTTFETSLPFSPHSFIDACFQRVEGRLLSSMIGGVPTAKYRQHHVFPNILISFTDMISLLHVVVPTGPQSCTSQVYQFGRVGKSLISRICCRWWGGMAANITTAILHEDQQLYPAIQRGLASSQQKGMLGRCEERIHQFQRWIQDLTRLAEKQNPSPASKCESDFCSAADCTPTVVKDLVSLSDEQ